MDVLYRYVDAQRDPLAAHYRAIVARPDTHGLRHARGAGGRVVREELADEIELGASAERNVRHRCRCLLRMA
jgi:hypothetical protein